MRKSGGEGAMMDEHTELVKPQMLPPEVNKRPAAVELYRIAILSLAAIGGVCVLGMIVIPAVGGAVSDGLIAIGSLAVGALAGLVGGQAARNA